jgi:YVTN family beta-propeller protein
MRPSRNRSIALHATLLALTLSFVSPASAGSATTIPVGTVPKFVAVNQTTDRIYVSNLNSNNVSVIDGATNTVIATVPVGNAPEVLDVNALTNTIYVANLEGNSVSAIDGGTNVVVATITLGSSAGPFGVAVDSTRNLIYVSNTGTGTVSVINGETNTVTATVVVGLTPAGVRVNANSNLIYVANVGSGTISVIDGQSDTVTDTFTLPQGAGPGIIAFDPITNRLFVSDGFNQVVYVLDASAGTLLKTITGGKAPFKSVSYVAMFQPGKSILISDDSLSAVIEVNESTYAATSGLKGGSGSYGLAVNRKTGGIYVAESSNGTVIVYAQ